MRPKICKKSVCFIAYFVSLYTVSILRSTNDARCTLMSTWFTRFLSGLILVCVENTQLALALIRVRSGWTPHYKYITFLSLKTIWLDICVRHLKRWSVSWSFEIFAYYHPFDYTDEDQQSEWPKSNRICYLCLTEPELAQLFVVCCNNSNRGVNRTGMLQQTAWDWEKSIDVKQQVKDNIYRTATLKISLK